MLKRITIAIPESVADRLDRLARDQYRDPKQQAAVLLLDGIERAEARARTEARRDLAPAP